MKFLGLRSVIYPTKDLVQDKIWWEDVLGTPPYYDHPDYVGFDVGGYELGLDPSADLADGPITYIGVENVDNAMNHFISHDCEIHTEPREVGDGIAMAVVSKVYDDQLIGLIYNPHFKTL